MGTMQPDQTTPRFRIALLNRAADGEVCARYEAHQVPAVGDLITASGGVFTKGTPFEKQFVWRVDSVVWNVAAPGSTYATQWAVHRGLPLDHGCCFSVDLMVWPAQGPHWLETPEWAYRRPEDEGDEPEDGPHGA